MFRKSVMKILIITQRVDRADSVLGFFNRWLESFSEKYEKVTVVCLQAGQYSLPDNVRVLSLGKEKRQSKLLYLKNFFQYIWQERANYDAVFVHMNQEYVILGAIFWKILGKKIYLWRNHKKGNLLTDLAVFLSNKVFYTSQGSYTAKFKKSKQMPVGVDANIFRRVPEINKIPKSILYLGRISPVKNINTLIEALKILDERKVSFVANVYGNPTPGDEAYAEKIKNESKELIQKSLVSFESELPNTETSKIYNSHLVSVNLTDSGSFDKTIIESMLCETLVLASNVSLKEMLSEQYLFLDQNATSLADKLTKILELSLDEVATEGKKTRALAEKHSLKALIGKLETEINSELN